MGWICFRGEYVNLVVAGQTAAGRPFSLVAGTHTQGFPYPTPESGWEDLLVVAGPHRLAVQGKPLAGFRIDFPIRGAATGVGRVQFTGEARDAAGAAVPLDLDLEVGYRRFRTFQLGKRYNLLDLSWVPGLRWTPCWVGGPVRARVRVGGEDHAPALLAGEVEHGLLTGIRGRRFAFTYDYLCAAHADPAAPDDAYAHVRFVTHALQPTGLVGRLLERYLRWSAAETVTLRRAGESPDAAELIRGNPHGVPVVTPPAQVEVGVEIEHDVPLGWADLARQLVRIQDAGGRALYGLREIFTPRPPSS